MAQSLIGRQEKNWKPLSEVNFSKNPTKAIRLFALDFYEVIAGSEINFLARRQLATEFFFFFQSPDGKNLVANKCH